MDTEDLQAITEASDDSPMYFIPVMYSNLAYEHSRAIPFLYYIISIPLISFISFSAFLSLIMIMITL